MNDTVDKLVIFLAKRDGIDKLVKTFQYVSKLVNWHVETTYPDLATRAKQWEVASGLSRKAFRTGRSLTGFNALRRSPGTTQGFRLLAVLANSGEMVYFFFDHFLWLARIGVIDAKYAKRMSFISAFVTLLPHLTHSLDGTKNLPHFATDTSFADQMAEGGNASRYVKLTKDQAPREDIKPGELNQPIDVPQLTGRKCHECGQPLPESFEPPADEPWTTGIFGCAEDKDSCWRGLFCPCVLFGQNVESLRDDDTPWSTPCVCHAIFIEGGIAVAAATAAFHGIDPRTSFLICEGLLFSWWMCGIYTGLVRQSLQKKYHLKNSPCDPCMVHCCLHWCALCQEHREMKSRLSDNVAMQMTIVNPPPVQEMSAAADNRESGPSSANGVNQTNLEMQAL